MVSESEMQLIVWLSRDIGHILGHSFYCRDGDQAECVILKYSSC